MANDAGEGAAKARRWLRVSEAAEVLGVSQHTLRRWADRGLVASRRTPSGQRQFSRGEVERLAGERAAASRDASPRPRDDAARVASLLQAGRAITSSLVPEEVLDAVAREATLVLGAGYCVIWEHVPEQDALVQRAGFEVGSSFAADGRLLSLRENPVERAILLGGGPVVEALSDPQLEPASRRSMELWGEKTCLSVPLRFGDERLGVLVLGETEHERVFTPDELELAEGLGLQASAAVHNARLFQDLERRSRELDARARRERLLSELSFELSSSLDLPTVLAAASRRISAILGTAGCDIYRLEEDGSLSCQAACLHGRVVDEWVGLRSSPLDWNASRRAIAERRAVVVTSLDDPALSDGDRAQMRRWGQKAVLAMPMEARGRVLGTIEVAETAAPRWFTDEEVATAEACARMAALAVDNATLYQWQADQTQRLTSLLEGSRALTSTLVIREVLDTLVRAAATSLGCPEALIFEYDAHADTLTMRSAYQEHPTVYEDLNKPFPLSAYPSDRKLLEGGVLVVETISDPELPPDVRESMEFHDEKTCLSVPLSFGGKALGVLTLIETAAERVFSEAELEFTRGLGEQAAIALHNARLFENVKGLHLASLKTLSSALSAKDVYTIGHAARVAAYAVLLAHELGWDQREVELLEEATYLHDVGKIAIADRVLLKSGALTDDEWEQMREHPVVSAEIIEAILSEDFVAGVRHHHERYDGGGYPDGLAGDAIPAAARILCVVDSYDAMSSRRIYQPALSYEECIGELRACRGSQFDPEMVDAFVRVLDRLEEHRLALEAVAQEAARLVEASDHARLRRPEDRDTPEFERVHAALLKVRAAHPFVDTIVTEVRVDEQRCAIVVDAEEDRDRAIGMGELVFYGDPESEVFAGRRSTANVVSVDPWGTWQLAAAPILDGDGAVAGLVCAGRVPAEEFAPGGSRSSASDTFAEIIRSAAARQTRAEIESVTDALTGLGNRRHFEQCLHEWVETALAEDRRLSLLFCDLDRFKRLNDREGHPVGDDVLRAVGGVLAASVRAGDLAARYGGDEFALLLRDADAGEAREVAERIRGQVAGVRGGKYGQHVSFSIGCATLDAGRDDAGRLLARADRAMYAAKERGRDCVVVAGEVPPQGP